MWPSCVVHSYKVEHFCLDIITVTVGSDIVIDVGCQEVGRMRNVSDR
jgi:hypothetical protein